MIAAALLSAVSTASNSSSAMASAVSLKTTEQQVRTLIPVTISDGSKFFVSGPCIVLKTQIPTLTVAQQIQALRPLLKADAYSVNADSNVDSEKKNDRNNNDHDKSSSTKDSSSAKSLDSDAENELKPEPLRCKRRIDFSALGLPRPQPAAMVRRNERERNRVKQVNLGFEILRQHVPQGRRNKKLSKVDTLKGAVQYIKYLQQLLLEADKDADVDVTTAISDTINIVSRPTPTTTTSITTTPVLAMVTETTSAVTTSTNTAAISSEDLMLLATPNTEISTSMDVSCEPSGCLEPEPKYFPHVFNGELTELALTNSTDSGITSFHASNVHDFEEVSELPTSDAEIDDSMDSQLAELEPARMNFGSHQSPCRSPTILPSEEEVEPIQVVFSQAATDLPVLPAFSSASHPPINFLFFTNCLASPERSPTELNQTGHLTEFHTVKAGQGCMVSDGSCPVSPSESSTVSEVSEEEEALGMSEGETWQDLSADIADWLCSKIDIDDPDVFG